jgi:hypothetical protein
MEYTKMGISIELLGTVLFITACINKTALLVLVFYVLVHEKNVWIKKTALKAALIVAVFFLLTQMVISGDKILLFMSNISNSFHNLTTSQQKDSDQGNHSNEENHSNSSDKSDNDEDDDDGWNWKWPKQWNHSSDQQNEHSDHQDDYQNDFSDSKKEFDLQAPNMFSSLLEKYPYKIIANIVNVLHIVRNVLLILLALLSLKRKTIRLLLIDSFIDVHVK